MVSSTQKAFPVVKAYTVVLEKTGTGYSAYLPELPGCVAAAGTREETLQLMAEAATGHLEGMAEDGDPIPEPVDALLVTPG